MLHDEVYGKLRARNLEVSGVAGIGERANRCVGARQRQHVKFGQHERIVHIARDVEFPGDRDVLGDDDFHALSIGYIRALRKLQSAKGAL